MPDRDDYYRLTCRCCATRITVVPEQQGKQVKCPDCYTMIEVGPPPARKKKTSGRGGQSWSEPDDLPELAEPSVDELLPLGDDVGHVVVDDILPTAATKPDAAVAGPDDEFKLTDTFDRPNVSTLYGLDDDGDNLLAPRKRRRKKNDEQESGQKPESNQQESVFVDDLPVTEPDIPALSEIGTLVPQSVGETESPYRQTERPAIGPPRKKRKQKRQSSDSQAMDSSGRPRFKHPEIFTALVGMITDRRVVSAAGAALGLMLIGGILCETIFPVGTDTSGWDTLATIMQSLLKAVFGYLPYGAGLVILWLTAGFVFRDAVGGHTKVQRWTVAGQSELWSSLLLFGFSFFIAGLPAIFFSVLMIPLRMMFAPLFLISAWYNQSPWMIVSTDWAQSVKTQQNQWVTAYTWFAAFAFAGLMAGLLFFVRQFVNVYAVDVILTILGVCINVVLTLSFAAIAGWLTGGVIESLDVSD